MTVLVFVRIQWVMRPVVPVKLVPTYTAIGGFTLCMCHVCLMNCCVIFSLSCITIQFLVGPPLGFLACYMVLRKAEPIGIYDRAYRLRYSKLQNRTDKFSEIGAAVGAGLGAALLKPRLQGGFYGAAFGVGLGVILHVLTTPKSKDK